MILTATDQNPIGVRGHSSIDHKIRNYLRIDCNQYAILDFIIQNIVIDKQKESYDLIHKELGFGQKFYQKNKDDLISKGLLNEAGVPSAKALGYFNYIEGFEYIWAAFKPNPGNKKEGMKMYKRAIKVSPLSHLKKCADNYVASKKGGDTTYWMHVSSFLNPEFQKYNDYTKIIKKDVNTEPKAEW
jgi:hypothetical protein